MSKIWITPLALLAAAAVGIVPAHAAAPAPLIPTPQHVEWSDGDFAFDRYRVVTEGFDGPDATNALLALESVLTAAGGRADPAAPDAIELRCGRWPGIANPAEAYRLEVAPGRVRLVAPAAAGLRYGIETLRQLVRREQGAALPRLAGARITDAPAFAWRGFMHDVGRNPQDVELLERFLDVMARYKLNVFHFHLTDNPGYRIECRVHPELNDPRFQTPTRRPGFFYTYAQLNALTEYARARGIRIVPEIDLPGHSAYFKAAFGFDMQDPRGMKILQDAVGEFLEHVPCEFLHLGSDEVHLRNPQFLDQMADFVRARGRKVIVWRPGGLPRGDAVTQLWAAGGRNDTPLAGRPYLDSRFAYINHLDPFDAPLSQLMKQPCGRPQGDALALGSILCHWPDNNVGTPLNVYGQTPVFPSLLAAAERYWGGGALDGAAFYARLPPESDPAFATWTNFEARLVAHRDAFFADWPFPYVRQTDLKWKLIGPFDHGGDVNRAFPVEQEIRDRYEIGGRTWTWTEARGATIHLNHFWDYPAWLPKSANGTAYALSYVFSPSNQTVGFWIGFNGYSRSGGRRGGPNPQKGQWSNTGSRVRVNDAEIPPPDWKQPGLGAKSDEVPFQDEDYFYRPPTPVALRQGWNQLLIRAPKGGPAWKWMFTCVPVRVEDGRVHEVEGLRFDTEPRTLEGGRP